MPLHAAFKGFIRGFRNGYTEGRITRQTREIIQREQAHVERERQNNKVDEAVQSALATVGGILLVLFYLFVAAAMLLVSAAILKWAYVELFER